MGYKKEFSKGCKKCGELWLPDMSNKYPKRALCRKCHKIWVEDWENNNKRVKYTMYNSNRKEKYKNFKMDVRKPHWKKINDELKEIKNRDDWRGFISKKMNEILNNVELMDYINNTDINKD